MKLLTSKTMIGERGFIILALDNNIFRCPYLREELFLSFIGYVKDIFK